MQEIHSLTLAKALVTNLGPSNETNGPSSMQDDSGLDIVFLMVAESPPKEKEQESVYPTIPEDHSSSGFISSFLLDHQLLILHFHHRHQLLTHGDSFC